MSRLPHRPCLSLPFTVVGGPDRVRLIAGEDFRYTLEGPGLGSWLPNWLPTLDGGRTLAEALAELPEARRELARAVVERLSGERVLVDGPPSLAHSPEPFVLLAEGEGSLRQALTVSCQQKDDGGRPLMVLCQDRLDYAEALAFNRRCLEGSVPWVWATAAPGSRGYVGPLFLPDAGPCLECLLRHFRRRSPAPEVYDDLIAHAAAGGPIVPTPLAGRPLALLAQLIRGKVEMARTEPVPAALFRLHILEAADLEVSSHRVFLDPDCPACGGRR